MAALRWVVERYPWAVTAIPLLILWEVCGRLFHLIFLPPLSTVMQAASRLLQQRELAENALGSLGSFALGLGLSLLLGLLVGGAMGLFRWFEEAVSLVMDTFLVAPLAALVPILMLLFGLGRGTVVATVFLFGFFVMAINTYAGVRSVDAALVEMGRSFNATRWQIFRRIVIPSALPMIMAGMRQAIGRAVNGLILGEMLIAVIGIGGMVMMYGSAFQMDYLYALLIFVVLFALLLDTCARWLERRLFRWRQR